MIMVLDVLSLLKYFKDIGEFLEVSFVSSFFFVTIRLSVISSILIFKYLKKKFTVGLMLIITSSKIMFHVVTGMEKKS